MASTSKIKKIKKSVTDTEYRKLMAHARGDLSIKTFNKNRYLMIFSLLYYSGMRINEITQIRYSHMDEVIKTGETIIVSHKTKKQRILYFSPVAIKEVKKYFKYCTGQLNDFVICSWGNPSRGFHPISLINLVNRYMKQVLGAGYTSHSFRQGLITEMGSRSINPKIIQSFIGHSNIKTTLGYIKPTAADVRLSLVR